MFEAGTPRRWTTTQSSARSPVSVAVAASLALMGDALLYAVLPAQAASLGIPLIFVGVLLSANRFVRLITNTWAASIYHRYGRTKPFFLAMVAASLTVFAYGIPLGVWVFLPARILWGTCWSFLNLGMYLSVLSDTDECERGQWMGRVKAISRIGTIVAVTLGAYLTDRISFQSVVLALGLLAAGGALVSLRDMRRRPAEVGLERSGAPTHGEATAVTANPLPPHLLYIAGFVFGFVMNGVVVGTIALLAVQRYGTSVDLFGVTLGVATLSGLLLGARWIIEIVVAPLGGRLGDRFGTERIVPVAATLLATALAILAFVYNPHWLALIALGIFIGGVTLSVCLDAVVGRAAIAQGWVGAMMSRYVTAQDLGAAVGPLVGYLVGLGLGLDGLYLSAGVTTVVVAALFAHSRVKATLVSRELKREA